MRAFPFSIEAGHVMAFRRAVGELDARWDPEAVPPPTFLVSADHADPEYTRRPGRGAPWPPQGSGDAAATGSGFHAETELVFHRHPRVGEQLTVEVRPGEQWTKHGRRGGALRFSETVYDYRDEAGELCVTMRWISVRTEHEVTG